MAPIAPPRPVGFAASEPRTIRVVRELNELEALRPAWSALCRHPLSDLDYLVDVQGRQPGFLRPHVVVVERGDRVVALIAAQLQQETIPWRIGSLSLFHSPARTLRIGAGGVMGDCDGEIARGAVASLRRSLAEGEADAVYLHQLASESALLDEIRRAPDGLSRDRFARTVPGWRLELPASFDAFLASRSRAVRKNYRRFAKRLESELGDVHVVRLSAPDDLQRIMKDSAAIARRTYHERLGVAFTDDARTRAQVAHALRMGWFEAYLLYRGAQPIAFSHGLLYRGTLFARETGFDPAYADYRPGIYLLGHTIAAHCAAGTRALDYGVMDAEYKRHFGTTRGEYASAFVFGATARGRALAVARVVIGAADRAVRRMLGSARARRWSRLLRHPARTEPRGDAEPCGDTTR